jgi:hypothetical protein
MRKTEGKKEDRKEFPEPWWLRSRKGDRLLHRDTCKASFTFLDHSCIRKQNLKLVINLLPRQLGEV